jgi:hypothetical protein
MLLGDANENWRLLRLTGEAPDFGRDLALLSVATRVKWGGLAVASFLLAWLYRLDRRQRPDRLNLAMPSVYLLAGILGCAAVVTGRSSLFGAFDGVLGLGWALSMVQAVASLGAPQPAVGYASAGSDAPMHRQL